MLEAFALCFPGKCARSCARYVCVCASARCSILCVCALLEENRAYYLLIQSYNLYKSTHIQLFYAINQT